MKHNRATIWRRGYRYLLSVTTLAGYRRMNMAFSSREVQYGEIFGGTIQEVIGHGSSGRTIVYRLVQKHNTLLK